ncbi:hypothetical protein B0T18DRAFT_415258 [Schizothecium vesticola]|uniref:Yeast cell wall synthesis Kre9/Knh1-like N-terminal domain-containing protein n=1 Tax=Schizothecium vesticola TaxID=314040 RepID=A0AA40K2D1_9PEZI|nr:hypothetical protein B0T18DRAFT_415258 [Schizothecium vesticola]
MFLALHLHFKLRVQTVHLYHPQPHSTVKMKTLTFTALLSTASALLITSPTTTTTWDLSSSNPITWTSVSTDPSQFALVLVDKTTTPETQLPIAAKVDTAAGKYDLVNFVIPGFQPRASNATTAGRYSIKALSLDQKNTGQLSESGVFEVSKSGVSTTKNGDSPTGTGSGAAVTETAKGGGATAGKTVAVAGVAAGVVAAGFVLLL